MKVIIRAACLLWLSMITSTVLSSGSDIDLDAAIKQLDRHIGVLEQFNTKNKQLKLVSYKSGDNRFLFIDEVVEYTHELLRICVKKMAYEESLDPLFVVWRLFISEYKNIDSEVFLQEVSMLLFSVYKNIFASFISAKNIPLQPKVDFVLVQHIIDVYNKISVLPIKELLSILDQCLDQFLIIMRDYGINENVGWYSWFQKFWWLPPVVVTSLAVTVIQGLQ